MTIELIFSATASVIPRLDRGIQPLTSLQAYDQYLRAICDGFIKELTMTNILTLFITYAEPSESEQPVQLENLTQKSYQYQAIKLRYQAGIYEFLDGEQFIPLLNGHSLSLDKITVTAQVDESDVSIAHQQHQQSARPATLIFDNNRMDPTLTKLKALAPSRYETIAPPVAIKDELGFLKKLNDKAQAGFLPNKDKNNTPSWQNDMSKLHILEQHYRPPKALAEFSFAKEYISDSQELAPLNTSGNILRDLGFAD